MCSYNWNDRYPVRVGTAVKSNSILDKLESMRSTENYEGIGVTKFGSVVDEVDENEEDESNDSD